MRRRRSNVSGATARTPANLGVAAIRSVGPLLGPGLPSEIGVTVANHGPAALPGVRVALLVDGVERARTERVVEGDAPVVLRLPDLAGASTITLRVDDGGDDDAGDRAAWVDGLFFIG